MLPGLATVFPQSGEPRVEFRETDPWYHVRAIEHQVANFPERFRHDPYLGFPDGGGVPVAPLLDWIAAGAAIASAGGNPSPRWVETIAAWLPAVLGALLALPVALLARRLEGGVAAAIAAPVAVLGAGQFLARSLLGFTDHHVLEVLLSTAVLVALSGALDDGRSARARALSAGAAGVALGLLHLTWVGTAALVLVLVVWMTFEFAFDLAHSRSLSWVRQGPLPAFVLAALVVLLTFDGVTVPRRNLLAALVAAGAAALLALVGWRVERIAGRVKAISARRILLAGAAGLPALALALWFVPGVVPLIRAELGAFLAPGGVAATVQEVAPLARLGPWWRVLWNELAVPGFLALATLAVGLVRWPRRATHPPRGESLMICWTLGLVLLTLRQNRFLYYLIVPAAVAAGVVLSRIGARFLRPASTNRRWRSRLAWAMLFAGALTLTSGFGLRQALVRAGEASLMSADWRESLLWLRTSTPDPFGEPAAYWRAELPQRARYSVAAWWDYGYWILRLGHRVPAADPTQRGAEGMARLLVSSDDREAAGLLETIGARYLILDAQLPLLIPPGSTRPSGKFRSIANWAGASEDKYVERVLRRDEKGALVPATLFHAAYFRTLLVRLYLFGGAAYEPRGPAYVAELDTISGRDERELVRLHTLPSYEATVEFLASRPPESFALVGLDPAVPCLPLAPSALFRRVHSSPETKAMRGAERIAAVEIFERTDVQ